MKFKVGDKVRISEATRTHTYRNYDGEMDKYIGTIMTIRAVDGYGYKMVEDSDECLCNGWSWCEEMVEPKHKFKVGDKVIGNELANDRYGMTKEGFEGVVTKTYEIGEGTFKDDNMEINGFISVNSMYFDLYTEPVAPEFSKKDLEIGYVVETRTFGDYMVFPSKEYGLCLVNETGFNRLADYNDELTMYSENECFDIMKVYGYTEYVGNSLAVSKYNRKLLWERKEVTCPICGTKF